MGHHICVVWLASLALLAAGASEARPERIRAGVSYYSDQLVVRGLVRDLAGEKNYEEVYQLYRYYEAVYDEAGRVVRLRSYERGELLETEAYDYRADGTLLRRSVHRPGQPPEVTEPEGAGADATPQAQSQGAMRP